MLGILFGFCCSTLTFATHIHENEHNPMFGLVFAIGFGPSLLIGGAFGLYLAFQVKEETRATEKRRIKWFFYKSEEPPWSSKA